MAGRHTSRQLAARPQSPASVQCVHVTPCLRDMDWPSQQLLRASLMSLTDWGCQGEISKSSNFCDWVADLQKRRNAKWNNSAHFVKVSSKSCLCPQRRIGHKFWWEIEVSRSRIRTEHRQLQYGACIYNANITTRFVLKWKTAICCISVELVIFSTFFMACNYFMDLFNSHVLAARRK